MADISVLTIAYSILFYVATAVLVVGTVWKIVGYARTPSPLKIPTTPAPTSASGVLFRMFREVVFFESLFKSNKWIWIFGWLFHFGLLLVLLRHLRYFTEPVWVWVEWVQPLGKYATFMMLIGLAGLWLRRIVVDRIRYISSPSDHLMLLLLVAIGLSGATMTFVSKVDIVALKAFFAGTDGVLTGTAVTERYSVLIVHLSLSYLADDNFPISASSCMPQVYFSVLHAHIRWTILASGAMLQ